MHGAATFKLVIEHETQLVHTKHVKLGSHVFPS